MNGARASAALTLGAGAVVLALFGAFRIIAAKLVSGDCLDPATTMLFQLGGAEALATLIGSEGGACAAERLVAASVVNSIDVVAFIPAYALMLIGAAAMLSGRWISAFALVGAALALGAAGADYVETLAQLQVRGEGAALAEAIQREAPTIQTAARAKYALLAASSAWLSLIAFRRARPVLGILGLAPIPALAALIATNGALWFAALALGVFWIALVVAAFGGAVRDPPRAG